MRKDRPANDYAGLVEPWKVRLILSRAKRLGLPRHEWQDAQQEVVMDLLGLRLGVGRACAGGNGNGLLVAVIDGRLKMMVRTTARRQAREEVWRRLSGVPESPRKSEAEPLTDDEAASVAFDLRQALAALPPRHQAVCLALSHGDTVSQIARRLGWGRKVVRRLVADVRRRLREVGFGAAAEGRLDELRSPRWRATAD